MSRPDRSLPHLRPSPSLISRTHPWSPTFTLQLTHCCWSCLGSSTSWQEISSNTSRVPFMSAAFCLHYQSNLHYLTQQPWNKGLANFRDCVVVEFPASTILSESNSHLRHVLERWALLPIAPMKIVSSSVSYEQMDVRHNDSRGAAHLIHFLLYSPTTCAIAYSRHPQRVEASF